MRKPIAIDLFCGLGGWTDGLLAEGWDVVGFDVERHAYGDHRYPAQLVLQDVRTIHGAQFAGASLIVASPPCQEYSYMAMPWSRAKAIAAEYRSGVRDVAKLTELFDACFRIQREAIEAAGHFIPLVVENVRGAVPWVGRSRWHYGSFYLWGDVPALMPITMRAAKVPGFAGFDGGVGFNVQAVRQMKADDAVDGGSWFNVAHNTTSGKGRNPVEREVRRISEAHRSKSPAKGYGEVTEDGVKQARNLDGRKHGGDWSSAGEGMSLQRRAPSKSSARKAASARIAKIPLPLARWIAKAWKPRE